MKKTSAAFNGIGMNLGNIMKLSEAETRSITAENVYGGKGRGGMAEYGETPQPEVVKIGQEWNGTYPYVRELGRPWKIRPFIVLAAGSTTTIMDIDGPGVIQHIWITVDPKHYRDLVIRFYWDGEEAPSVESPLGDFFCNGWKTRSNIGALPINVNPLGGFNCYFPMPFRKHARVTIENRATQKCDLFFYAINYALTEVGDGDAYFHAQFRRTNPTPYKKDYVILDGVKGHGQYVGTFLAWQQNSDAWWGEGELKAFLDGDGEYPTICGTGTEDYFGGAWGFTEGYSAPYLGYRDLTAHANPGRPMGHVGHRHNMYRFHIMDPIRFAKDIRVTIQALGLGPGRYVPLQDDIASVAYWYQAEPHAPFPKLPTRDECEVI